MNQRLAQIALVIDDYDKAIKYYTEVLNFDLIEDKHMDEVKRWVIVAPKGSDCRLLLARATDEHQRSRIGDQTGGRVFLFLHTDNFERDYENLIHKGVSIVRPPVIEEWGEVCVFEDDYGNLWDLIQPS